MSHFSNDMSGVFELDEAEAPYTVRHGDILAGSRVRCGQISREEATALYDQIEEVNGEDYNNNNNNAANGPHHHHNLVPNPITSLKSPESTTCLSINNRVCNSKYTWYSFLPKNLWEQFHRPINFYFLVVAFLQFIPAIAPVSPLSTVLPLSFAFMVTAVKEGMDDWRRHKQDDEDNNRPVTIIRRCWWPAASSTTPSCPHVQKEIKDHHREEDDVVDETTVFCVSGDGLLCMALDVLLVTIRREDIVAGDYVLVESNEEVPCDMIALVSGKQQQPRQQPFNADDNPPPQSEVRTAASLVGSSSSSASTPKPLFQAFGSCYVSTENLDGESDSKPKTCLLSELLTKHVQKRQQQQQNRVVGGGDDDDGDDQLLLCCQFLHSSAAIRTAKLVCDKPNRDFRQFEGRVEMLNERVASSVESALRCCPGYHQQPRTTVKNDDPQQSNLPSSTTLLPCSVDHLLLSSSYLRPNESTFVIGLAVYVGGKTKVGCNSRVPATKWADLDKRTNNYTKRIFILQVVLTFMSTLIGYFVLELAEERSWYLGYGKSAQEDAARQRYSASSSYSETTPSTTTSSGMLFEPVGPSHHHHHHLGGARYTALFFMGILPMRYFLMFTVMVPISFKVLVEMSKFWVMKSITWDASMTLATPLSPSSSTTPHAPSSSSRRRQRRLDSVDSKSYESIQSAAASPTTTTPINKGSNQQQLHQNTDNEEQQQQFSYQGALVNNSTLAEDLGQVQVVLTDKTGTLTNNEMNIRYVCCVAAAVTQISPPLPEPTSSVYAGDELVLPQGVPSQPTPSIPGTAYEAVLDVFEATPSSSTTAGLKKRGGHHSTDLEDDGHVEDFRSAILLSALMSAPAIVDEHHHHHDSVISTTNLPAPPPSSSSSSSSSSQLQLHAELVARTNQHRMRMMEAMSLCNMISPNPTAPKNLTTITNKSGKMLSRQASEDQEAIEAFTRKTIPINQLWSSPSPDELALMDGARQAGVYPTTRSRTHSQIVFPSSPHPRGTLDFSIPALPPPSLTTTTTTTTSTSNYEYIARLDFTSERGLMSVLVRNNATKEILLLTKGSDERVLPLCNEVVGGCGGSVTSPTRLATLPSSTRNNNDRHNQLLTSTAVSAAAMLVNTKLQQYSREGLRTLVFAYRIVSQEEADEWLAEHTAASSITTSSSPSSTVTSSSQRRSAGSTNRATASGGVAPDVAAPPSEAASSVSPHASTTSREVAVRASEKRLERNLTLLGLTAVEDLLQIGVPRTIKSLRAANIKVWMLTGDKTETARQIAISCGLVSPLATDVSSSTSTDTNGGGLVVDLTLTAAKKDNSSNTTTPTSAPSEEQRDFQQLIQKMSTARRALILQQQQQHQQLQPNSKATTWGGDRGHEEEDNVLSSLPPLPVHLKIVRALIYVPLVFYKWSQSQLLRELWCTSPPPPPTTTSLSTPNCTTTTTTTPPNTTTYPTTTAVVLPVDADDYGDPHQQQPHRNPQHNNNTIHSNTTNNTNTNNNTAASKIHSYHHSYRHSLRSVISSAISSVHREVMEERMDVNSLFIEGIRYDVENTRINQIYKANHHVTSSPSTSVSTALPHHPPAHQQQQRPRSTSISICGRDPWTGGCNNNNNNNNDSGTATKARVDGNMDAKDPRLIFARTPFEEYEEEGQFEELFVRQGLRGGRPHRHDQITAAAAAATETTASPLSVESLRNNNTSSNLPATEDVDDDNGKLNGNQGGGGGYSVCVNGAMLDVLGLPEVSTGKVVVDSTLHIPARLSNWFQRNFKQSRSDVYNKNKYSYKSSTSLNGNGGDNAYPNNTPSSVLLYSPTATDTDADNDNHANSPSRPLLDKSGGSSAQYNGDDKDDSAAYSQSRELARREFTQLLLGATTVVCSRVTPSHKAKIVALVKNEGLMTLSIGDGGNDVAMIQEAHVGVGILGKEGRQAAKASDFTLAQFRYLATLLLVHGHYAYHRTAFIVQYSFYKGMILAVVQLLYNTQGTLFSGQTYWNSLSLTLYNGYFTVPLTLLFVMDVPLAAQVLRRFPQLYVLPQSKRYMNSLTFFLSILRGLSHGIIIYFICNAIFSAESIAPNGQTTGDSEVQWLPAYSVVILLQVLLVICESSTINWVQWFWYLGPVGAICSYPILFTLYSILPKVAFHDVFLFVASYANFYLGVGVATGIVFLLSWGIWMPVKYYLCPSLLQLQRHYIRTLLEEEEKKKKIQLPNLEGEERSHHQHHHPPNTTINNNTDDDLTSAGGAGGHHHHRHHPRPSNADHDDDGGGSQYTMETARSHNTNNINTSTCTTPTHTTRSNSCDEVRARPPRSSSSRPTAIPSSLDPGGFWTSFRPRL